MNRATISVLTDYELIGIFICLLLFFFFFLTLSLNVPVIVIKSVLFLRLCPSLFVEQDVCWTFYAGRASEAFRRSWNHWNFTTQSSTHSWQDNSPLSDAPSSLVSSLHVQDDSWIKAFRSLDDFRLEKRQQNTDMKNYHKGAIVWRISIRWLSALKCGWCCII